MLGRYEWRHDSVLSFIYSQFKPDQNVEILVDLPTKLKGITTLSTDIIQTTLRSDLVLVNRSTSDITIMELSVPFETNISDTHNRKIERYADLITDLETFGYNVNVSSLCRSS